MKLLKQVDQEIDNLIAQETKRQEETINLIASENYASIAVMQATGSVFTNKYAEGYPGKRYYAGCQIVDQVELLAQDRCKELFNPEHVNVQPLAGSSANMAVYFALLKPGETVMGMRLAEGGHLTHGHPINFSGVYYNAVQYSVNPETEQLDFNEIEKLAVQYKPKLIIAGASAYSRIIDFEQFKQIAEQVGAYLLVDMAHIAGLIAAGVHPSPIPYADVVTSTTHKSLRGPRGGLILCKEQYAQQIDKAVMPGLQGGPFINMIAAKAVAFQEALQPGFIEYQKHVITNAQTMAKKFQELGYRIVSGGTDNHLFVVDLRSKKINGRMAERTLEQVNINVSRSCIPFDPEKPWLTSGIRIGTPAITTRGFKKHEVEQTVHLIDEALSNVEDEKKLSELKQKVMKLAQQFPIY